MFSVINFGSFYVSFGSFCVLSGKSMYRNKPKVQILATVSYFHYISQENKIFIISEIGVISFTHKNNAIDIIIIYTPSKPNLRCTPYFKCERSFVRNCPLPSKMASVPPLGQVGVFLCFLTNKLSGVWINASE